MQNQRLRRSLVSGEFLPSHGRSADVEEHVGERTAVSLSVRRFVPLCSLTHNARTRSVRATSSGRGSQTLVTCTLRSFPRDPSAGSGSTTSTGKRLALGSYPNVGLKEARAARDDARKQQQRGADPVLERQVVRLSSKFDANATFEVTARKFHVTKKAGWSDHYAKRWLERISKDVFPWLGKSLPCPKSARPRCCRPCGGSRAAGYANCRTRCSRRAARCSDTACQLVDANAIRRSISEAR